MTRLRIFPPLAAFAIAMLVCSPATLADEVTDIGYIDQAAIANIRSFRDAGRQLAEYKYDLNKQFSVTMHSARDADDRQRIAEGFEKKILVRRRQLLGPLLERAQIAVASVASSKNLSVVVDKRIVIIGGQDVTRNVLALLTGVGAPVPPVSTPPPSNVGFVNQAQIDDLPKLKTTMEAFAKFRADQQKRAQAELRAATTDMQRQQVVKAFQERVAEEQKRSIVPVIDQTRAMIADVAKKKKLLLVIERGDLLYGGTDISGDVVKELGG